MRAKFSEIAPGTCFTGGRGKGVRKKTEDGRQASVGKGGKVRSRGLKGDPDVEPTPCPLRLIGVGMRGHPDQVVEIGCGKPREKRR